MSLLILMQCQVLLLYKHVQTAEIMAHRHGCTNFDCCIYILIEGEQMLTSIAQGSVMRCI